MYQWTFYRGECQHLSKEVYLSLILSHPFSLCCEGVRRMASSLQITKNIGLSFPFSCCMIIMNNHICVLMCEGHYVQISSLLIWYTPGVYCIIVVLLRFHYI